MKSTTWFGVPRARKSFVVYTCLFGRYENLNDQPVAKSSGTDFICFTDRDDLQSESWQIRKVKTLGLDPARESRRPKLMPHLYLQDYEASLYIDNSVQLLLDPQAIYRRWLSDSYAGFACLSHPLRNCIYQEASAIVATGIDSPSRVLEQIDFYRANAYPENAGLIAGMFLLRNHHDPRVIAIGETWFAHVLRFSKRDQLSFNYIAFKSGFHVDAIDANVDENEIFRWPVTTRHIPYGFDPATYVWLNPDVSRSGLDAFAHYTQHGISQCRPIRYHAPPLLDFLANTYKSDRGSAFYKRHSYTRIYEHCLSDLRDRTFTLLEIGLGRPGNDDLIHTGRSDHASSLRLWRDYFPTAQIHGVDVHAFSNVDGGRITITQADATNADGVAKILDRCDHPVGIIIDGAGQTGDIQQATLANLFAHLAPGGLYFIENLHEQPDGADQGSTLKTVDLLKALRDNNGVRSSLPDRRIVDLRNQIASIQLFDSMDTNSHGLGADALALIIKH